VQTAFLKNLIFSCKKLKKNNILDRFDLLISKMIFKKYKKYHFDTFRHEKLFEKQQQPHSQTPSNP
jgi:hypothetical protein